MELVWTPEAIQDRDDIYEYLGPESPLAVLTLDELFSEQAAQLVGHPDSGRLGRAPRFRELVVHPSYMLIYDIVGMQVRILRVVHTSRQWPPSLG
ncbi:MAG: type II toxin-antitoxin system RelE/ParE family toxin [Halomonas sp.]|nr:type II toxin-antitoxin system RelE/ParE family toxin [Halomonas sp.]MDN6297537.1 type II toxin-antitoxin system RelE/ParE family toxin [Halomonas sp.]